MTAHKYNANKLPRNTIAHLIPLCCNKWLVSWLINKKEVACDNNALRITRININLQIFLYNAKLFLKICLIDWGFCDKTNIYFPKSTCLLLASHMGTSKNSILSDSNMRLLSYIIIFPFCLNSNRFFKSWYWHNCKLKSQGIIKKAYTTVQKHSAIFSAMFTVISKTLIKINILLFIKYFNIQLNKIT